MKPLRLSAALLLLLSVGCVASIMGQSDRGMIRGTVTDPNGAIVPNARVILTSPETGETREVTTGDEGFYTFAELRPVTYTVAVEAPGFQRAITEPVKVGVQVTHTVNITMQIGAVTNEVTVEAEGETLQASTTVIQSNVTERQVRELPLQVTAESGGRTPLAFIFLDSNVASTENASSSSSAGSGTNATRFRVSGGQALGTEILIDGAATRRSQNGTFFSEVAPGPNAFQEFTLSTSTYSAEYGNSSGGVVNFILKSGTNDYNGEGYYLGRNEAFNANRVRNIVQGLPRDLDRQHDFGFNLGGPILVPGFGEGTKPVYLLKNRAFFFFNYEGYRFTEGENVIVTVPTARMRTGDFGELLTDPAILQFFDGPVRIYDPRLPSNIRQAIPGNRLDLNNNAVNGRSLIDPAGLSILQAFPLPNRPGVFRNYAASSTRPNDMNQYTIKTDFVLTDDQRLTFSFSRRDLERLQAFNGPDGRPRFPRFPLPFVQQDVWSQEFKSNLVRLQHNWNITPTLLNFLNIGYTFYDVANRNTTDPFNTSSLGIPIGSTQNSAFPRIGFPGYGEPESSGDPRAYQNIGSSFFTDRLIDGTVDISDFMTYVAGRHTFKAGGNVRFTQFNARQRIDPGGSFNFRHDQTASDADPNGGYPIASLITGATEFAFNFNNSIDPAFHQMSQSYFVQDDIKLTQKLTLNLGLRYDLPGLRVERFDRFRTFDPDVANPEAGGRAGGIVSATGEGGLQADFRSLARTDKSNWGPRVGAAYAINNKTVIRAGAGLYYAPIIYGFGGDNDINTGLVGYNTGATYTPEGRNARFFLSTFPGIPPVSPGGQFLGSDVQYFDQNFRTGRTFQYSIDLQRELPFNLVASLSYIGHRADRLRSNFGRLNALPLNALRLGNELLETNVNDLTAQQRAYATSVGVALPASSNAVYAGFNGPVRQALRPFPQYGRINNILESQGVSTYHSFRARFERRFAQGFQAGASYSWSRLVSNASEDLFGGGPQSGVLQNPFDISSLKTESPNNPPHVFVTNFLFELPFGKGRRYLKEGGLVNAIVGGFQIGGIFRYQSGTPIIVFTPENAGFLDRAGYLGNLRLNLTGQPLALDNPVRVPVGGAPDRIRVLNPAAFSTAANFEGAPPFLLNGQLNPAYAAYYSDPQRFFGTSPAVITDFNSDPFFSEDLSILKKTRITERLTLEIGAEFFNVFNRVRYGALITDFRSSQFGTKELIERPRVVQLRGRVIF